MKEKLAAISQDFENGKMSIHDIKWLIEELKTANERIKELVKDLQVYNSTKDLFKEEYKVFCDLHGLYKKAPYEDLDD